MRSSLLAQLRQIDSNISAMNRCLVLTILAATGADHSAGKIMYIVVSVYTRMGIAALLTVSCL